MTAKKSFKFVYIPCDLSKPVEELTQEIAPGKEVECLIDRLKDHFKAAKPKKSSAQQAAQRAAFAQHLPAGTQIDEKMLEVASSIQMVETISLLTHTRQNGHVGVNMYVDDEGALAGLLTNLRATEIGHCAGLPIEVKGDAFIARLLDNGDDFERMDLHLNEVSSSADWVQAARKQQEERRKMDTGSAAGLINKMKRTEEASTIRETIREITPAESVKDGGNAAFKRQDWAAAEEAYSKAIELDSSMLAAVNNRAMVRLKLEKWSEAEADCTTVLEREPSNVKALLRRATARQAMGNNEQAKVDLEAAVKLQPNNKEAQDKLQQCSSSS